MTDASGVRAQPRVVGSWALALSALGLAALAVGGPAGVQAQTSLPTASSTALTRGLPDFADLVDQVGPAVVKIRTTTKAKMEGSPDMDPEMQEFFRRFFGVPIPTPRGQTPAPRRNGPPADDEEQPQTRGVGSGFIYSGDGLVMTNAHVVDGADEVFVTLTDKREFKAKVIGADKRTDVAVVKIEASNLPIVKIGDVDRVRVGEWVVAIGSPFGLDSTVTAGIVSAKARDTGEFVPLIQTDVAINPGNSGGPLLNLKGEVIGINSQIYSRSGGYMGISFAIPMDEATRVADQLRSHGRVVRGRIGVGIADLSKEVAESMGMGKPTGAQVTGVEAGAPAEKAGIEAGDVILKFDGKVVERAEALRRIVSGTKPGSRATVQVLRRGVTKDLQVQVAELEPEQKARKSSAPAESAAPAAQASVATLGVTVTDLNDAQKRDLKLKGGVVVSAVEGVAARAGLREGDVILQIGNVEVIDAKQFESAVAKLDKGRSVTLLYRRGEWAQYISIRPSR